MHPCYKSSNYSDFIVINYTTKHKKLKAKPCCLNEKRFIFHVKEVNCAPAILILEENNINFFF